MTTLTPEQFVQQWEQTELKERASAQSHFESVCRLVGHPLPHELDPKGEAFTYEYGIQKLGGGQGYADVWYDGHFAIEYKGKGKYKDLEAAYRQLLQYSQNLNNPPLLIVCDIENWEIHTNFNNAANIVHRFKNQDILQPRIQRFLHALFEDPNRLHPNRTTVQVTADAANVFKAIADHMRGWNADPQRIAHFLTKLVFCLFAEDTGLLPAGLTGYGIFTEIVNQSRQKPSLFRPYMESLFKAMADGGDVLMQAIPWFNGALFDDVTAEDLVLEAIIELQQACRLDWSAIEPAIFGTLFERSLDPSKRSQLGAHYTSREDIMLIVEPVLMEPLYREWNVIRQQAEAIRPQYEAALTTRDRAKHEATLKALQEQMLKRLREIKILDPACGSGNFLYVSLQLLMNLEKTVIVDPIFGGLTMRMPEVHPQQLFGIETNIIAHDLASIVVWIGYIQWRQNNGYLSDRKPILEDLHENIKHMDAIMTSDGTEPDWPEVDVIVGNPPFLGDKKMRRELGDVYVTTLRKLYDDRVSGRADLVSYWFEKARTHLVTGKVKRVGLLATQSIRAGANRKILKRIKDTGDIFMGWSDRAWILDGAEVRVSMIGFDNSSEKEKTLDGVSVTTINPDLTASVNLTKALQLQENNGLCFIGTQKGGAFDLDNDVAQKLLKSQNSNGLNNADIVRPWVNATEIVQNPHAKWIIYFPDSFTEQDAAKYEAPFNYLIQHVKPERLANSDRASRDYWWLHQRTRGELNTALQSVKRYIGSPRVAKHRLFVWLEKLTVPDSRVVAISRDDDYFFGVLHSKIHEVWSLATSSRHGVGNDPTYNAESCFETFPFPWSPSHEDTASPAYQVVAAAARQLHEERQAWLDASGKDRTLTNLYNALNVWRGKEKMKVKDDAADFAPRLDILHEMLDKAVCDAYGWPHDILRDEDEILRLLLELNLKRSGG